MTSAAAVVFILLLATLASAKKVHPLPPIPNSCFYSLATPHRPDPRDISLPFTEEHVCAFADTFALGNVPTVPVGRYVFGLPNGGPTANGWQVSGTGHNLTIIAPSGGSVGAHSVYVKQGAGGNIFYFSTGVLRTHSLTSPDEETFEHITFCQAPAFALLQRARQPGCTGFCPLVPCCGFAPFAACPATTVPVCPKTGISFRARSFGNTGGEELYVGVGDVGVASNRAAGEKRWVKGSCYPFSLTYDPVADTLTGRIAGQGVGHGGIAGHCNPVGSSRSLLEESKRQGAGQATTVVFPNFASQLAAKTLCTSPSKLVNAQIHVVNRDTNTQVNVNELSLDMFNTGSSSLLNPSDYIGNGFSTFPIPANEYGRGFTIRGVIDLEGTFSNSQELSKVEINICCK